MSRNSSFFLVPFALAVAVLGCRGDPTTVMTRLHESRELRSQLTLDFHRVTDASNRAVLADTNEDSRRAALESATATSAVEEHAATLAQLLQGLRYTKEAAILADFRARFSEYRKLDERIVALAVENTNLEAQALSFGPAEQASAELVRSLRSARGGFPAKEHTRFDLLAAQATLALRETQVLFAPHIAERDEGRMAQMEGQMNERMTTTRATLQTLDRVAPAEAKPAMAEAVSALGRFEAVSKRIVALSRRNTNVLSLELALRHKPALVAACDAPLERLQAALAREGPKSTR